MSEPRFVYIDAGASDGGSVRDFRAKYPGADRYEMHCFEPDPRFKPIPGVHFHRAAVSTFDGTAEFYLGKLESSSLFREKTTGNLDRDHPVKVACIDFSRWVRSEFDEGSQIVLKLDVEGEEYDLLDRMLIDGSLRFVRDLHVDWHYSKVGIQRQRHDALIERIHAIGIPLTDLSSCRFLEHPLAGAAT